MKTLKITTVIFVIISISLYIKFIPLLLPSYVIFILFILLFEVLKLSSNPKIIPWAIIVSSMVLDMIPIMICFSNPT